MQFLFFFFFFALIIPALLHVFVSAAEEQLALASENSLSLSRRLPFKKKKKEPTSSEVLSPTCPQWSGSFLTPYNRGCFKFIGPLSDLRANFSLKSSTWNQKGR